MGDGVCSPMGGSKGVKMNKIKTHKNGEKKRKAVYTTILEKSLSYKGIGPIYLKNQSILKTSEGFVIYIEFPFVCHQARLSSSYQ